MNIINHPISYVKAGLCKRLVPTEQYGKVSGHSSTIVDEKEILVGNEKLMRQYDISLMKKKCLGPLRHCRKQTIQRIY